MVETEEKIKPKTVTQIKEEQELVEVNTNAGKVILVMGESGSGKTTSMRNLDPATTFYFDCDKKGLSWKGWKNQYNGANKNYLRTSDNDKIRAYIKKINTSENAKHIKTIIIDTLNGIMVDDEFRRMQEKGFDKWQDLAVAVWDLIADCNCLRDDLSVIFTGHSQTDREDNGYMFTRLKTSGRKLDKIVLESKFTTVLLAKCINGRYVYEVKSNNSTAKTPMGAFDADVIDNDITIVLEALKDY